MLVYLWSFLCSPNLILLSSITLWCQLVEFQRLSSPFSSRFFFPSSHLLVQPASFQLLHVSRPSIFSLVVLFSSFRLHVPASFFSTPSDRITCPTNPSFLLRAVCCSVSSSSIPDLHAYTFFGLFLRP